MVSMKRFSLSLRLPKGRDLSIQFAMILLNLIGVAMVVSASMSTSSDANALVAVFIRQSAFMIVGYVAYVIMARWFKFERIKPLILPLAIGTVGVNLVPLLFPEVNGARAWIPLPYIGSLQPGEFAKLAMLLVIALYLGDLRVQRTKVWDLLRFPFFIFVALAVIILVPQSDLGTAVILVFMSIVSFLSINYKRFLPLQLMLLGLIVLGVMVSIFVLSEEGVAFIKDTLPLPGYMLARFENTINPFVNRFGTGYQLVNGLVAFVRGGWFGVGFGQGLQKYGYLPAARTDFILAIIGEEFGFVGVMTVVLLYTVLILSLLMHALRAKDDKSRVVLVGVAMYLFSHFVLNIGGAISFIPLTGVPLLMLSSGGSSTVSIMMALGIAQAIIVRMKKARG
jgi:cell division protein FtsW